MKTKTNPDVRTIWELTRHAGHGISGIVPAYCDQTALKVHTKEYSALRGLYEHLEDLGYDCRLKVDGVVVFNPWHRPPNLAPTA